MELQPVFRLLIWEILQNYKKMHLSCLESFQCFFRLAKRPLTASIMRIFTFVWRLKLFLAFRCITCSSFFSFSGRFASVIIFALRLSKRATTDVIVFILAILSVPAQFASSQSSSFSSARFMHLLAVPLTFKIIRVCPPWLLHHILDIRFATYRLPQVFGGNFVIGIKIYSLKF